MRAFPLAWLALGAPLCAAAAALPAAPAARAPHPNSLSTADLTLADDALELVLRCQVASLLEVLPGLDGNADGALSGDELALGEPSIEGYLRENYRVRVGAEDHELALVPSSFALRQDELAPPRLRDWIDVAFDADLPGPPRTTREVVVESTLFAATSPDHRHVCSLRWSDAAGEPRSQVLLLGAEQARVRATLDGGERAGGGAFRPFLRLGFEHVLGGWDHVAFVLVLVLASRRIASLLGVVTAFTLAHSITLALATLGVVDVAAYSRWIEATIAFSILYVALDALLVRERRRSYWIEAFVFGLVHGLGFASFLADALGAERSPGVALLAFNLGVEAGQIAVVLVVLGALALLRRRPRAGRAAEPGPQPGLAPLGVKRLGAGVVALVGLWAFVTRLLG